MTLMGLSVVPIAGDPEEQAQEVLAMTMSKTNTSTPCAACRLLRRRCAEDCPFSPYFSQTEPLKFAYVHKVFGASNVAKMLMVTLNPNDVDIDLVTVGCITMLDGSSVCIAIGRFLQDVPESQRADTATSLVYEATMRLRDPVYGCIGAISAIQKQLQYLEAELDAARSEVLRYKLKEARMVAPAPAPTLQESNLPTSTLFSMVVPSSAQPSYLSQLPPLPPSLFQQSSTSSGEYNSVCPGNIGYFG
ncbi:hypothetical protein SAY86_002008 [Trapa natans]|uniref:LOB domain-containing protein n=1 Tax=Trapa natans TaxID=22666 RepID=A0AAN7LIH3_TRANT|nr:hypothetical protein SAY86_002008 [Trapa natans]